MVKEKANKKIAKIYSLAGVNIERVKELATYYGCNESEMIARIINDFYGTKYRIERVGHQGGVDSIKKRSQKETREDVESRLMQMSVDDATKYLIDLGYFEEPTLCNTALPSFNRYVIKESESGDRFMRVEYFEPTGELKNAVIQELNNGNSASSLIPVVGYENGVVNSYADTLSIKQIINELKKQKMI